MRLFKIIMSMMLTALIIAVSVIPAGAFDTGYVISELTEEEKDARKDSYQFTPVDEIPVRPFFCYDVNDDGQVAVYSDEFPGYTGYIGIYDSDGEFLRGYTFYAGSSIYLEWAGEILNVYFVRSNVIVALDENGTTIDMAEVPTGVSENRSYETNYIKASEKKVGDEKFVAYNVFGKRPLSDLPRYKLVHIDADGNENVIYDAGGIQVSFGMVALIFFVIMGLIMLILSFVAYAILYAKLKEKSKSAASK